MVQVNSLPTEMDWPALSLVDVEPDSIRIDWPLTSLEEDDNSMLTLLKPETINLEVADWSGYSGSRVFLTWIELAQSEAIKYDGNLI